MVAKMMQIVATIGYGPYFVSMLNCIMWRMHDIELIIGYSVLLRFEFLNFHCQTKILLLDYEMYLSINKWCDF